MENELIKTCDKSGADYCPPCDRCGKKYDEEPHDLNSRVNSELYGKEVDQYYFYFLKYKAS